MSLSSDNKYSMRLKNQRTIFHVDMDSFFSSIEVRENLSLKGLPVVVGADPKEGKGRGVVSTASYEAREYGIYSGMPISKAYKLCPHAKFLPVNMPLYRKVSSKVMSILRKYADKFEQVSVDEAYLDVTHKIRRYESQIDLALEIKKEIYHKEKLTCSIGIGPNKTIAKIASDFKKPDGLTLVEPHEVKEFLRPLPVRKLPGIGKKTEKMLNEMGIENIGQLAEIDLQSLIRVFGNKLGYRLHLLANGVDESDVGEIKEVKSLSRQITFEEDTSDSSLLIKTIDHISEKLYRDLTKEGYEFRTVSIKVRLEDFETHTRARTFDSFTKDPNLIKKISKELLKEFLGKKKIRMIGIRLSNLERIDEKQRFIEEFII